MNPDFRLEREMLPWIIRALPHMADEESAVAWTSEYATGYRQIDVLAAYMPTSEPTNTQFAQLASAVRRLTYVQLALLAETALMKQVTAQSLAQRTWLPGQDVRQHLDTFVGLGLVRKVTTRSYSLSEGMRSTRICTVSIEAKLADWCGALQQALYNKSSVDYSYVALPLWKFRERTAVLAEFQRCGIGLLGLSNCGTYEILVRPKRRPVDCTAYMAMTIKIASEISSCERWSYLRKGGEGERDPIDTRRSECHHAGRAG